MVKDVMMIRAFAYILETGLTIVSGLSLRVSAIAITPVKGKPTPLMQKPKIAISILSPACCPKMGGKIKLPAPKKKENSIKAIGKIKVKDVLLSVILFNN